MENRTYNHPFSASDVAFLVKSMRRFVHLSKEIPSTSFCLLQKNSCIGITVLIHNLLRLAGYYDNN